MRRIVLITRSSIIPRAMVFDTPELLESILLQLPMLDLISAQRVDRTFQHAIKKSPSIQRALFFRPYGNFVVRLEDPGKVFETEECASNAACKTFRGGSWLQDTDRNMIKCAWVRDTSGRRCDVVFNPLASMFDDVEITDISDELDPLEIEDLDEWEYETVLIKNARLEIGPVKEESGPDASWKSMLLTQPPVKCMVVDTMGASHWHVLRAEKNAEGITVRQLQQFQAAFANKWRTTVEIWAADGFRLTPVAASAADILAELSDAVNVQEREDAENWE